MECQNNLGSAALDVILIGALCSGWYIPCGDGVGDLAALHLVGFLNKVSRSWRFFGRDYSTMTLVTQQVDVPVVTENDGELFAVLLRMLKVVSQNACFFV